MSFVNYVLLAVLGSTTIAPGGSGNVSLRTYDAESVSQPRGSAPSEASENRTSNSNKNTTTSNKNAKKPAEKSNEKLISDRIPSRLKAGSFQLIQITQSVSRLRTYSVLDHLEIPAPVMETLGYFDGRTTEAALETIANEKGIKLERGLIQKLCDFELLVDPA